MSDDEITVAMRTEQNLAWFGVDRVGHIGAFESCGFAWIHPHVLRSNSERLRLLEAFNQLRPRINVVKRFDLFATLNIKDNESAYLESASHFARRGLFVFEVPFLPSRETVFVRLVSPQEPIALKCLPTELQKLLAPIKLPVNFADCEKFAPPTLRLE